VVSVVVVGSSSSMRVTPVVPRRRAATGEVFGP
jgi:hypothetical protein